MLVSTLELRLPEKVRLSFNPDDQNNWAFREDPILKENWSDDLFRNIWLCYAVQHIRDQYHTRQLREMVSALRKDGHPRSTAHLAGKVRMLDPSYVIGNTQHDMAFAVLIWTYTTGERDMPWEFECPRCNGTGEVCYSSTNYGPCVECSSRSSSSAPK